MSVSIDLFGPLKVTGPNNEDLTPRSAKARGMIALLATSPITRRGRTWLQSRLWSDRGREQAAASLRQVLTETRKALGPFSAVLVTDRLDVALDPEMLRISDAPGAGDDLEFLEGLDVRDEEFEDWLRLERSKRQVGEPALSSTLPARKPAHAVPAHTIRIVNETSASEGMERFFCEHFTDSVSRSLSEMLNVTLSCAPETRPETAGLIVRTSATLSGGLAGLRIAMERGPSAELIWSSTELVHAKGLPPVDHENVLRLINNASEGIVDALYGQSRDQGQTLNVSALAHRALNKIFSMERSEHLQADGLLNMAFELDQQGIFLAWRSMLRLLMLIERHEGIDGEPELEAIAFAHRALELEPMNSMVLAAAANSALILEGQTDTGQELAERAARLNPANPFAVDALSVAAMYRGDADLAHQLQLRAKHISGNTQFSHWFDMGCCMTATLTGDLPEAITMARKASAMSPKFRPPLRYLVALHMRAGNLEQAYACIEKLRLIEPSFETEKLWDDDAYPVRDLRRSKEILKALRAL